MRLQDEGRETSNLRFQIGTSSLKGIKTSAMVDNWSYLKIEEVAEKVACGPFGASIKVDTFVPQGVPVISGNHLRESRMRDAEFNFISEEHADKLKNANVYRGDVIFTHAGNIEQVAYIPPNSRYERYVLSQRQFYMRCNLSKILPSFVTYYFKTAEGKHKLLANSAPVGVPSIAQPVSYLRSLELPVPPLDEQQAIASILGALDDKIENNRWMNETLEAMARAIFKSWFVDFDPVRAKATGKKPAGMDAVTAKLFPDSFVDSPLGKIPKGWSVEAIKKRASNIQYGLTTSAISDPVGPKFLRITDIREGKVDWGVVPYCSATYEERDKYKINDGDIFVARTGASTGDNIYITDPPDSVFASYLVRFQFANPHIARIVAIFMRTDDYFDFIESAIGGSAQPNASAQVLSDPCMVFPTYNIAERFWNVVHPLDKQAALLNRQSSTLAAIRDTLLPKLMSGEVRIKDAEKFLVKIT